MTLLQEHLDCIVAAVLAVNNYGIERSFALLPAMRSVGLLESRVVVKMDVGSVIQLMNKAGFNRGLLMEMMAGRLMNLMKASQNRELDLLNEYVKSKNKSAATDLLCKISGIGPKVASDAWMLISSSNTK